MVWLLCVNHKSGLRIVDSHIFFFIKCLYYFKMNQIRDLRYLIDFLLDVFHPVNSIHCIKCLNSISNFKLTNQQCDTDDNLTVQQFIKEQFWAILQFAYSPPDIVIHQIAFCFLIFFAISSYRTVQILVLKYLLYSKLLANIIHIYLSSRTEYYFNPGSSAGAN